MVDANRFLYRQPKWKSKILNVHSRNLLVFATLVLKLYVLYMHQFPLLPSILINTENALPVSAIEFLCMQILLLNKLKPRYLHRW